MIRPFIVIGTRPEAIKLAPVVHACQRSDQIGPIVCLTGQHRDLLAPMVDHFGIKSDERLALMTPDQTLANLTACCLTGVDQALSRWKPDCVIVQGDTTTVLAASVAAFYRRIPVVHVEAGLRTGSLRAPWPEEFNRRIAGVVADLHCAPTPRAAAALLAEGVPEDCIQVTGNTVIDALLWTLRRNDDDDAYRGKYAMLGDDRMILVTGHRRESFGKPLLDVCLAIARLAGRFPDCQFVYPVHSNPHVRQPVRRELGGRENIHLIDPVPYPEFVWLLNRATLVITDSGGVQEEAPTLGKPVLVTRDCTERPEAVECGAAILVGTESDRIVATATELLDNPIKYAACQVQQSPYGDGHAAQRIVNWILEEY